MDFLRKLLPVNLEHYLRGTDFPIGKQESLRRLEHNGVRGAVAGAVVKQVGKRLPRRAVPKSPGSHRAPEELAEPAAAVRSRN
jgi:hypothetical protein